VIKKISCLKKKELKEAIYNAQNSIGQPALGVSTVDELTKLVNLQNDGVLNEHEFQDPKLLVKLTR